MTEGILALVGAIVGAVIGILGTYIGAIKIQRKNWFQVAGKELRQAFLPELIALDPSSQKAIDPFEILRSAFKKHQGTVNEFEFFLPIEKRKDFREAWRAYYQSENGPNHPFLEQYSCHLGDVKKAQETRTLAMERIGRILEFTE